ncbi:MAG: DegV family protein [Clostridia bacterium]|nr:DegV family protein [Clostridia bacterium]
MEENRKIIITSDSTADLDYLFEQNNIPIVPLSVILGDRTGRDGIEIQPETIYQYYATTKKTPKTAAVSPEEYYEFFKKLIADGSEVIHFTISSKMSSCYDNACTAASECGSVRVVDSRSLSTGIGLQVLYAQKLASNGLSSAQIYEKIIKRRDDIQASFVVDTMEFLYKGGRCNGLIAFVASVLKIKPQILVNALSGEMEVGKKYIGKTAVAISKYVAETLNKYPNLDDSCVFITHTSAPKEVVEKTREMILNAFPSATIYETIAGSTITSHCGKGTLGILFYKNKYIF